MTEIYRACCGKDDRSKIHPINLNTPEYDKVESHSPDDLKSDTRLISNDSSNEAPRYLDCI